MKRLYTVLSLILVLAVLALPAVARADAKSSPVPTGWTWDELNASITPDGWTWDEV